MYAEQCCQLVGLHPGVVRLGVVRWLSYPSIRESCSLSRVMIVVGWHKAGTQHRTTHTNQGSNPYVGPARERFQLWGRHNDDLKAFYVHSLEQVCALSDAHFQLHQTPDALLQSCTKSCCGSEVIAVLTHGASLVHATPRRISLTNDFEC